MTIKGMGGVPKSTENVCFKLFTILFIFCLMDKHNPASLTSKLKYLIDNSERQQCAKDADFEHLKATTQCYGWYVFQKGYNGEPIIKWL